MKTLTKLFLISFLALTLHFSLYALSFADIPHLINYQGKLTDKDNKPVLDGTYSITFRIYDAETSGSLLWEETQPVSVSKGIFSVMLGGVTALNLAFDKPYWLEIKVGSEVMSPRQRISSVGYAVRSETTENALVTSMNKGTNASATTFWRGDGTWATPVSSYTYSGAQVFNGNAPTSWTDLDLSGTVGVNKALVFLKVKPTGSYSHVVGFRMNGDTENVGYLDRNPKGAINHTQIEAGKYAYMMCQTDASGIIEWYIYDNLSDLAMYVEVVAYIKSR